MEEEGIEVKVTMATGIAFILGIIVTIAITHLYTDESSTRIERLETLMNMTEYRYNLFYVHENMTLAQVRDYYDRIPYKSYKYMFTAMPLNYICDGTNDDVLEFIR